MHDETRAAELTEVGFAKSRDHLVALSQREQVSVADVAGRHDQEAARQSP